MHPALRMENISSLPISLRRSASLAKNGSLEHLRKLRTAVINGPSIEALHLLPVFYIALDPVRIPDIPDLDEKMHLPEVSTSICRAAESLQALNSIQETPPEAYPDLWGRVWPWTQFLDTYPYCNPVAAGKKSTDFSILLFDYIGRFHSHPPTAQIIYSTPGARAFVAKIWPMLLETGSNVDAFQNLCHFIGSKEAISNRAHLSEFAEGLEGSVSELALLVVKHITSATARLRPDACLTWVVPVHSAVNFAMSIRVEFGTSYVEFYRRLVSHGIAGALVRAVKALMKVIRINVAPVIQSCFLLFNSILYVGDRRQLVIESLEADLMQAIMACAVRSPTPTTLECLRQYLAIVIPESLLYHSVLSKIVVSLVSVKELVQTRQFVESGIHDEWQALKSFVEEPLRVLAWFNSPDYKSYRACDNMERVIGCMAVIANTVTIDVQFALVLEIERLQAVRDRSYIRAVLDDDYTEHRKIIFRQQILFLSSNPVAQSYVLFRYTGFRILVRRYPHLDDSDQTPSTSSDTMAAKYSQKITKLWLAMGTPCENPKWRCTHVVAIPAQENHRRRANASRLQLSVRSHCGVSRGVALGEWMSPLRTAMQALPTIWCALATCAGPGASKSECRKLRQPRVPFVLPSEAAWPPVSVGQRKKKRSNLSDPAPPVRKPMASCSGRAACGKRGREARSLCGGTRDGAIVYAATGVERADTAAWSVGEWRDVVERRARAHPAFRGQKLGRCRRERLEDKELLCGGTRDGAIVYAATGVERADTAAWSVGEWRDVVERRARAHPAFRGQKLGRCRRERLEDKELSFARRWPGSVERDLYY
ncbi:hypothetical protein DFH06DRAFT_1297965 [Mycena polygramma]|nr:hypothetical protein DFH06DRAFT_1297965 [Mycena polygramma]